MRAGTRAAPGRAAGRASSRARSSVDREHLAAYDRVCGFRLRDELPATYPHVLAFPLAMELLTGPFPFSPLGLVHVANRIEQLRPLRADEQLDAAAVGRGPAAARARPAVRRGRRGGVGRRGRVARSQHVPAPRGRRLVGRRRAAASRRSRTRSGALPGDIGRRYAGVSGDNNPIHTHPLLAKALGQPGTIAHGMWTKARCLAALEGSLPGRLHGRRALQAAAADPGPGDVLDRRRLVRRPRRARPAAPRGNGQLSPRSRISACAESRLLQLLDAELALDAGGALELDVAVVDDLEAVAPRVEEVEPAAGEDLAAPRARPRRGRPPCRRPRGRSGGRRPGPGGGPRTAPGTGRPCRRTPSGRRGRAA